MNLHQSISQELQCSRFWVDRALTIFNLIAAMDYFSVEERTTLVNLLVEKLDQAPISAETLKDLFSQTPLEDWTSLPKEYWPNMILTLGGDSTSELLPECLTLVAGDPPAEPDGDEIASMKEEMWKDYIPPDPLPYQEEDLEETSHEESILVNPENLESRAPQGNWGVIFRCYSPVEKQFSYTLLNTNRVITSNKISPRLFWTNHRSTDWPEARAKEPLCFQTPICEEEDEIIKDFIRQEENFDCLYLFSVEQNLPNPLFSETFSIDSLIKVEHAQQFFCSALGFQARNQASMEWIGGLKTLNLPKRAIIVPNIPKTKLSWQVLAQWRISIQQVSGKPQDIPALWKLNIEQNQRLNGSGGQAGQLTLRNASFLQLKDAEKEYFLGKRTRKIDLPFRPFLNSDSHHQDLFLGEQVVELSSESSLLEKTVAPTLRKTPPIKEKQKLHFRTALLSKELEFSLFVEQANQLRQKNASLDTELSASNIVDLSINLELQWGTKEAGFHLSIPAPSKLALVQEKQAEDDSISLSQQIGSLNLFSETPKHFSLSQEILRKRTQLKTEKDITYNLQQSWQFSLENPEPLQSVLHQSLQIYHDQIGWSLSQKD